MVFAATGRAPHFAPSLKDLIVAANLLEVTGALDTPARARRRVPAAERREQLIAAAVHEFAHGGLHGTPVERIARRVGVAQPYVFSLFSSKRELFLAAVERSFDEVAATFREAASEFERGCPPRECRDALEAMGIAYRELLRSHPDELLLQHQCYAACDDDAVRARVRRRYAELVELVRVLAGGDSERLDDFLRRGMALNVAAALGVDALSASAPWVGEELRSAAG
ncbi:MAG TPA: TetR/AcrR family transcriptional regulator [Solirubrobacteraceae bacterium]|jgi:AcrR family transcriptional regulator|nr:TetR/AcrR family transcriptional regulator [Solirubrobacteraceae bacterium]